ncbi:PAS domain S-box-containing protein [Amycolatopsis xylanica]|uniref:Oxygen sensor histidine kinase NreB n=1 Tax=Amycolatopsis xylanica TaxID=589385 RepID=A0A1H3J406_9PSEU|nr:PAS domain S-box protein [Amycolatopsis xylanica]SDY33924.1 PAS domain S-box-containing protein [Amycolatopsis xylanica]
MTDEFRLLAQGVVEYAIFMVDVDGLVTGWNPGAERITGYRADEIIGEHISRFYAPEAAADGRPEADLAMASADGRHVIEDWRVRRGGERFWAHVVTTPLRDEDGRLLGFGKVVRDLSAQADADDGYADLRRTFAHLVRAQETERRRIAWDVHDDSIQSMIAASMRLQVLIGQQPEATRQVLVELDASIQAAVRRLRVLVAYLRPPTLDGSDLVASLRGYLEEVVAGWGLAYTLRHELTMEPSPEVVVNVFRIAQEALVNVHKHARAAGVEVSLTEQQNGLLVRISDDGIGIAASVSAVRGEHIGMIAMRERAEAVRGWLNVESQPGEGTTVEFWVPGAAWEND